MLKTGGNYMEEFLNQIKMALDNKLYFIALQSTLTIPDICAKLSTTTEETTKKDYIKWYEQNIINKQQLTAKDCYYFRCGMLHEGKAQHKNMKLSRVIFLVPNDNIVFSGNTFNINGKKAINIDLPTFCNEMINCALKWWNENKDDAIVKNNYESIIKYYPNGFAPFIGGIPVIA